MTEQCWASEPSQAFTLHYNAKYSSAESSPQSSFSQSAFCWTSSWLLLKLKKKHTNQLFGLSGILTFPSFLCPRSTTLVCINVHAHIYEFCGLYFRLILHFTTQEFEVVLSFSKESM